MVRVEIKTGVGGVFIVTPGWSCVWEGGRGGGEEGRREEGSGEALDGCGKEEGTMWDKERWQGMRRGWARELAG